MLHPKHHSSLFSLQLFLFIHYFHPSESAILQSLNSDDVDGAKWILQNKNLSISIPALVPGSAHLDLLAQDIIEEPYVGLNVDNYRWIKDEEYWTWLGTFTPNAGILSSEEIQFVAEGIDTVATIHLNEISILNTSNAFITNIVDIDKTWLMPGTKNLITIKIFSPTRAALSNNATCTGFCPSGTWGSPLNRSSYDQCFNYIRSSGGVNFGWDFAPNFAPSGIWKRLYFRGYTSAILEDVTVVTIPTEIPVPLNSLSSWNASIQAYVTAKTICNVTVTVSVSGVNGGTGITRSSLNPGLSAVTVNLQVSQVSAWWPSGLGAPSLYNATVTVSVDGAGSLGLSSTSLFIGFRTVDVKRPAMGDGALMYFEVNGHAHFLKGANYVPPDAFSTRHETRNLFAPQINSFIAAHFSSLRIWGGGYPLSDSFYELAQESGMLLWHEMPYACAAYPTGGSLLLDAANEAHSIVLRLQKYGIAIWGGNNEVGQIQGKNSPPGSPASSNYSALFFDALGETISLIDPSRTYVPTSPGSGLETPLNPISFPGMTPARGDMHVYVYDGNCLDPTRYPRARAATEFGWQSYSTFISLAELISPPDFDFWSPPVQRRDTHGSQQPQTILFHNIGMNWLIPGYNGSTTLPPGSRDSRLRGSALNLASAARSANQTSKDYLRRADGTFSLPTDALGIMPMMSSYGGLGPERGTIFRDTLFMTQVSHAACLKTEAESYRRGQSSCEKDGEGCTSTILYWMANELWPAATKSSIEWSGRWKATHYEAARGFLAPILVSPWSVPLNDTMPASIAPFGITLAAHPPASLLGAVPDGLLRITCWSWTKGKVGDYNHSISVKSWPTAWGSDRSTSSAGGSVDIFNSTLATALSLCGCDDPVDCILSVAVFNSSSADPQTLLAENSLNPVPLNAVHTMRNPQLEITNVEAASKQGSFLITITAAVLPVQNVWIESLLCCGHFSSNNFLMLLSPMTLLYTPGADTRGWKWAPPQGTELNVTAGQFAASLSIWSLFDTVDAYSNKS